MIDLQRISGAWDNVIDFLLPRICCGCGDRVLASKWLVCEACLDGIPPMREPLCLTCGCPDAVMKEGGRCTNCPPGKIWFSRARGVAYYGGISQVLVEKLKYHGRVEYAPLMALAMARLGVKSTAEAPEIVVPVPLHPTRRRERGFNQSLILAKELAALRGLGMDDGVLRRDVPTPTQTRLKKRQRRANIAGAFSVGNAEVIRGKRVLLVDDVYTTGSTLNECSKVLVEAGAASVECIAYARAVLE